MSLAWPGLVEAAEATAPRRRVRPSDPAWPSETAWAGLDREVGGRLKRVQPALAVCRSAPDGAACRDLFRELHNPYAIRDDVSLTQTSGWADAWVSAPSAYAVAASRTEDVVAAVNFARRNNLRLVVRGGGHSYQGTSNAADSLLIWTREMHDIALHDGFVARGGEGRQAPVPAVTLGAGTIWRQAYDAVTTQGGRYVQGGGCMTVGVAGLIQSGGFGSFSKAFGMAASGLLEAEVVTADGAVRIANAFTEPELFWALKGGGGGSLGVVTRLTLLTHDLPERFGGAAITVKAASDEAFRRLVERFTGFYADSLFNPHWGEQVNIGADNTLRIGMVCQGLETVDARLVWQPLLDWVAASPKDFSFPRPLWIDTMPARHFWDPAFLRANLPALVVADDRPGAPVDNVIWAGDHGQAGQFMHGYRSAWLPASLLGRDRQAALAATLFAASRQWDVSLHFNKGLAGAPADAVDAAREVATNPAVRDAFALAILSGAGSAAFPGLIGHEPDLAVARRHAAAIDAATGILLQLVPNAGSYLSEGNYFDPEWQASFWGGNYPRLAAAKRRYDPGGLFFVHHGVGSEAWSDDGFTPAS